MVDHQVTSCSGLSSPHVVRCNPLVTLTCSGAHGDTLTGHASHAQPTGVKSFATLQFFRGRERSPSGAYIYLDLDTVHSMMSLTLKIVYFICHLRRNHIKYKKILSYLNCACSNINKCRSQVLCAIDGTSGWCWYITQYITCRWLRAKFQFDTMLIAEALISTLA